MERCVCLASLTLTGLDWTIVQCLLDTGIMFNETKGDSCGLTGSLEVLSESPRK